MLVQPWYVLNVS